MKFFKKAHDYISYHGLLRSFFYLAKLLFLYCHRSISNNKYTIRKINERYKMYLDLRDKGIAKALYLYGTREKDQVFIVEDTIKRGMRVLDIGANIGYYALLEAGLVGDEGKVYAFEPHPNNFKTLEKNIELNNFSKRIELYQKGMSDREGIMEFFVSLKSNLHTLNPEYFKPRTKEALFNGSIKIDVVNITRFLQQNDKIDFVRMDIEGHEIEVLNGIFRGLDNIRIFPSILLETHFPKYDDKYRNMRNALSNLFSVGYEVETIVSNNESKSPLGQEGYKAERVIKTDQMHRGIYRRVDKNDALRYVCDIGGIRALFLKKKVNG